jgi:membrane protease YdiL (CAAX protease family)
LFVIDRFPLGPLRKLRDKAQHLILAMFGGASILQLAVVALAAGVGEELLFRGLIQAGLSRLIGGPHAPLIGLAIASVVFGVCHWLDTTYAVLAGLAGAYFGWLLLVSGSLWTPIVAHATYDFLALAYLVQPNRLLRSSV